MKKKKVKKIKGRSRLFRNIFFFGFVFLFTGLLTHNFNSHPQYKCANSISCEESIHFEVDNTAKGIFNNQVVYVPPINTNSMLALNVLGTETSSKEKHIYVDLAKQTVSAFEGDDLYMQTKISSGKTNATPTGEFTIWVKILSTRMTGGSGSTYYDLPNVPFVMFFYNQDVRKSLGYSFHGAYWHNNFGHAMSHGCINMRQTDAQKLYEWATPQSTGNTTYADTENTGTKVTIFGEPPA